MGFKVNEISCPAVVACLSVSGGVWWAMFANKDYLPLGRAVSASLADAMMRMGARFYVKEYVS